MPRYYFELTDGRGLLVDDEGVELPHADAALEEGVKALVAMVRDRHRRLDSASIQALAINVRDELGPVAQIGFSIKINRKN
jgi:hypothetical protein